MLRAREPKLRVEEEKKDCASCLIFNLFLGVFFFFVVSFVSSSVWLMDLSDPTKITDCNIFTHEWGNECAGPNQKSMLLIANSSLNCDSLLTSQMNDCMKPYDSIAEQNYGQKHCWVDCLHGKFYLDNPRGSDTLALHTALLAHISLPALLWLEWFFSINGLWKYPLVLAKYCDYPNVYGYHTKGYACFLLFFSMFLIMLTMQLQCAISVGGKCIFTKAWYITTASTPLIVCGIKIYSFDKLFYLIFLNCTIAFVFALISSTEVYSEDCFQIEFCALFVHIYHPLYITLFTFISIYLIVKYLNQCKKKKEISNKSHGRNKGSKISSVVRPVVQRNDTNTKSKRGPMSFPSLPSISFPSPPSSESEEKPANRIKELFPFEFEDMNLHRLESFELSRCHRQESSGTTFWIESEPSSSWYMYSQPPAPPSEFAEFESSFVE